MNAIAAGGPMDDATLAGAVEELSRRDPALAAAVARFGAPPLWAGDPGFGTLVQIILEQQVSLASGRAAFGRLRVAASPLTAATFLGLDDAALLRIGFSRQKARYARALAAALAAGTLDLDAIASLDDSAAQAALLALPGIGPWTASIYLLMVLRRPDVWPAGDIALQQAAGDALGLAGRPGPDALAAIGDRWRPWRSVAARILWHDYLGRRGRA